MHFSLHAVMSIQDQIPDDISLNPLQALGIPIALVGAVFLSVGTQMQHRGVEVVERDRTATAAEGGRSSSDGPDSVPIVQLVRSPMWVVGTAVLGIAVLMQLWALALAPLLVVQPLGAIALVVTAVLNSRLNGHKLGAGTLRAIFWCIGGIGLFVTVAALFAVEREISNQQALTVLTLLLVVLVAVSVLWLKWRSRISAFVSIIAAGVLYGFLVTLMKVVIHRVTHGTIDWAVVLCGLGVVAALLVGLYFVQLAHASGPPDLVIAGLTVIDPLVAVMIGVTVLGEASATPVWAIIVFTAAGAGAVFGVFQLAKHHPQLKS
ncbi:MAG: multidrug DMT transporter permease [Agrococcus casei]|uniref:multidrug DMT transporter permease n=1 Tax=Agrococcus casei TaxID=343512 RepID=UPI003F8FC72B